MPLLWKYQSPNILLLPVHIKAKKRVGGILLLICAAVMVLDINIQLGVSAGVLYAPVILASLFLWDARITAGLVLLATAQTTAAFFLSPHGTAEMWIVLMNRGMSLLAIWSIGSLALGSIVETRRYRAQERITAELSRSNSDLNDFASVASHDLLAPVRKISAFSERLLTSEPGLSEKQRDYLQRIERSSRQMQSLISDLLQYAKLSFDPNAAESVDLNRSIRDAIADLEEALASSGAEVTLQSLPVIEGNSTQLRQLFQNLIGNSIKYADPERKPEITITSTVSERSVGEVENPQRRVTICLKDNGIGFDQRYADQVFKVFRRLHPGNEHEGTGIGLSVCKRIVDNHGGEITVTSEVGTGTEFKIVLPLSQHSYLKASHAA